MEKEINLETKGKSLFLILATVSLIFALLITTVLWWFIAPRLHEISKNLVGNALIAKSCLYALRLFFFVVVSGHVLLLLTCVTEKDFFISKFAVRIAINFLFPLSVFLGKIAGIKKDKIRNSFVFVNNSFVNASRHQYDAARIMILLPHCLQVIDCPHRITVDIANCKKCGRCDIGDLSALAERRGVKIAIASGGTLARRIIIQNRPKLILAVACERDLVSGIRDTFPIPVFGILNDRPNGPCINTKVAVKKIESVLDLVISEK